MSKAPSPKTDRIREMRELKTSKNAHWQAIERKQERIDELHNAISAKLIGATKGAADHLGDLAAALGAKGGKSKSPAKIAAAKQNGMKGGKPKRLG